MADKISKKLSKCMSWLLRHGLLDDIGEDGYVTMNILLKNLRDKEKEQKLPPITEELVEMIVKDSDKQRFKIIDRDGVKMIRASQGHSIKKVKTLLLLEEIDKDFTKDKIFVHGTYRKNLESIKATGLSKCSRNHIHLTTGLPDDGTVISGMRGNCNVIIYVDVAKAMDNGLKFYLSDNGVVLSEGDDNGFIPSEFFEKIVDK